MNLFCKKRKKIIYNFIADNPSIYICSSTYMWVYTMFLYVHVIITLCRNVTHTVMSTSSSLHLCTCIHRFRFKIRSTLTFVYIYCIFIIEMPYSKSKHYELYAHMDMCYSSVLECGPDYKINHLGGCMFILLCVHTIPLCVCV